MYILKVKLTLSVLSDFIVALAAIHRSTFSGLERYFGLFATLGACCGEHLTSGSVAVAATSVTFCLPGFAAGGAALRFVSVAFRLEELLFLSAESEGGPAIGALE